jgi:hypothetical protein
MTLVSLESGRVPLKFFCILLLCTCRSGKHVVLEKNREHLTRSGKAVAYTPAGAQMDSVSRRLLGGLQGFLSALTIRTPVLYSDQRASLSDAILPRRDRRRSGRHSEASSVPKDNGPTYQSWPVSVFKSGSDLEARGSRLFNKGTQLSWSKTGYTSKTPVLIFGKTG